MNHVIVQVTRRYYFYTLYFLLCLPGRISLTLSRIAVILIEIRYEIFEYIVDYKSGKQQRIFLRTKAAWRPAFSKQKTLKPSTSWVLSVCCQYHRKHIFHTLCLRLTRKHTVQSGIARPLILLTNKAMASTNTK